MIKWIFFSLNNSPQPICLCSLLPPAVPFWTTTFFILRSAIDKHNKLKEEKTKQNNNKPTNLIFPSTGSQPFTNIFWPRPTKIEIWPNSKIYNGEEIFHVFKNEVGGAPLWGLKVQRMPETIARPCCPQRVNSGQVTMLSQFT